MMEAIKWSRREESGKSFRSKILGTAHRLVGTYQLLRLRLKLGWVHVWIAGRTFSLSLRDWALARGGGVYSRR